MSSVALGAPCGLRTPARSNTQPLRLRLHIFLLHCSEAPRIDVSALQMEGSILCSVKRVSVPAWLPRPWARHCRPSFRCGLIRARCPCGWAKAVRCGHLNNSIKMAWMPMLQRKSHVRLTLGPRSGCPLKVLVVPRQARHHKGLAADGCTDSNFPFLYLSDFHRIFLCTRYSNGACPRSCI